MIETKKLSRLVRAVTFSMLLSGASWSTGCATSVHGVTQRIPVSTVPPGAQLLVADRSYTTPCTLKLARSHSHELLISMEGFYPESRHVAAVPTRAILGNIFAGGLIGMGVDALSGANNKLVPEVVAITLQPLERATRTTTTTMPIDDVTSYAHR